MTLQLTSLFTDQDKIYQSPTYRKLLNLSQDKIWSRVLKEIIFQPLVKKKSISIDLSDDFVAFELN